METVRIIKQRTSCLNWKYGVKNISDRSMTMNWFCVFVLPEGFPFHQFNVNYDNAIQKDPYFNVTTVPIKELESNTFNISSFISLIWTGPHDLISFVCDIY